MSSTSSGKAPTRPPQVTMAGWVAILSGVFVVLAAWETIANLGSLETTEMLRGMLGEEPLRGAGFSLEQAREARRISAMVAAAGATAAVVLGVYALRRDRVARLALSVVAVPVLLAGFGLGTLSTTMLAVAALMLWLQPARDWYAGRQPAVLDRAAGLFGSPARPGTGTGSGTGTSTGPGYSSGPAPTAPTAAEPDPAWSPPSGDQRRPDAPPDRRPPVALVRAVLLTAFFAGTSLMISGLGILALAVDSGAVMDSILEQDPNLAERGFTTDELTSIALVGLALVAAWSLLALVAAALTMRGAEWARVTLLVVAVVSGLLALLGLFVTPIVMAMAVAACALCVVLLTRREVVAWTRARSRRA